jgi:hypothetical protein
MIKFLTLVCFLTMVHVVDAQIMNRSAFTIGETIELKSDILNETRILNIYLPASYEQDSLRNYPVIYLLYRSKDEDFIHAG